MLPKGSATGRERPGAALRLDRIGLESEFETWVDGEKARPEALFRSPRSFIRGPLMHRAGRSYHLPTGPAVYFDTGVIELATPLIEVAPGCGARAGRSLWEGLHLVRRELDAWERRTGRSIRLVGFSSHYNVSFGADPEAASNGRSVERLARLLVELLPPPVMLLAANRRSTGVGVRPRGDRIEVTVDFTPSASLMIATATLLTGIVREVMRWPSYDLAELARRRLPVIEGVRPHPHTSRKGWLANLESFRANPFAAGPDEPLWQVGSAWWRDRTDGPRPLSLREVGAGVFARFRQAVRRVADPFTYRLIHSVLLGEAPSLLDLPDRPPAYEDVGRLCLWDDLFPESRLARSRYERVLIRAITGQRLRLGRDELKPIGMRGWSEVVFRRTGDDRRVVLTFDQLLPRLDDWERAR